MSTAVCTITKGTTSIDLLSSPYCVGSVFPLGNVPRSFSILSGPHADLPRLAGHAMSDVRTVPFSCEVTGTDGDDLEANLNALYAVLPGPGETATLTIGRSDSAYTGTLTVLAVQELSCEYDLARDLAASAYVTCDLVCEPWVYGASDTLYNASPITVPRVLDLSAMVGDAAAPLDMLFAVEPETEPAIGMLVLGAYPVPDASLSLFVRRAVTLSWSGGAAAADTYGYPDGSGNTVWKTNASTGVYTDVDVSSFLPGSYAVYANVKRDADCSPATIETAYTAPVAITNTILRRQLLGIVTLPTNATDDYGTTVLRVTLKGDGADYVYCNTIEFVPVSWGIVGWAWGGVGSYTEALRWADHLVYATFGPDDLLLPDAGHAVYGRELMAHGGSLVISGEAWSVRPTAPMAATVSYKPRWGQFPSAGGGT